MCRMKKNAVRFEANDVRYYFVYTEDELTLDDKSFGGDVEMT